MVEQLFLPWLFSLVVWFGPFSYAIMEHLPPNAYGPLIPSCTMQIGAIIRPTYANTSFWLLLNLNRISISMDSICWAVRWRLLLRYGVNIGKLLMFWPWFKPNFIHCHLHRFADRLDRITSSLDVFKFIPFFTANDFYNFFRSDQNAHYYKPTFQCLWPHFCHFCVTLSINYQVVFMSREGFRIYYLFDSCAQIVTTWHFDWWR